MYLQKNIGRKIVFAWAICLAAVPALSNAATPSGAEFHRAVYALLQHVVSQQPTRTEEAEDTYTGSAAARYRYRETRYFDVQSGRPLGRVRRDARLPEVIHISEVNIYDAAGKIVRDYGSIAMPWAPQNPDRTFINLHHYNGDLHSFRQYDIYGEVGYEACDGALQGRKIHIALDGSDIGPATTTSPDYKACFDGMEKNWRDYLTPH
jgi:hypothetical protein